MCGIFCAVSREQSFQPPEKLKHYLAARGPDSAATKYITYHADRSGSSDGRAPDVNVTLHSTVLSLRGSVTVEQPYSEAGSPYTLCWNGEAWSIDGKNTTGNDTEKVFGLFRRSIEAPSVCTTGVDQVAHVRRVAENLSLLAGPYAFVFCDRTSGLVFFGRDFLGRRSLLWRATDAGDLLISSVTTGVTSEGWSEVSADGIYCVDLRSRADDEPALPPGITPIGSFHVSKVSYCFSDSTVESQEANTSVLPRLILNKQKPLPDEPLSPHAIAVDQLQAFLRHSLRLRISNISEPPHDSILVNEKGLAPLAILFSGGLDCTVLARMCHDILSTEQPVDLLNVAFENPRLRRTQIEATCDELYELCPDRITGRASHAELLEICPARDWRFVAINVPYSENIEHRTQIISLMHPHNTEMDLSIASALYFAARGRGTLDASADKSTLYCSPARVLLSGLGADELFGGYTRHTAAFRRGGYAGLLDELELDVARLGQRNLGRDDRVMSHWGREVRFPFLDESLVSWALRANVSRKVGFGQVEVGEESSLDPEKKVLRCLALKLGMRNVAREKKRAIQFGARTAKMETGKTKGTTLLS